MRTLGLVLLGFATALASAPASLAGVAGPATPVGSDCVLVGTDSCSNGPFTSNALGQFGASGAFEGSFTVTVSSGASFRSISCSGTLVGAVIVGGSCSITGPGIPLGSAMSLACNSAGTGVLACYVHGA